LKGEEIPFVARIFSIVDVWDAMTNDRPYRKAIPHEEVISYLMDQSGRYFDPNVVDGFLRVLNMNNNKEKA
jgi:putative two-component system response regulator